MKKQKNTTRVMEIQKMLDEAEKEVIQIRTTLPPEEYKHYDECAEIDFEFIEQEIERKMKLN